MRPTRRLSRLGSHACALLALASCGGGDGPTTPDNTTVTRIEISPTAPVALVSGTTTTFSATAFNSDNKSLGAATITWSSSNEATASVTSGVVTGRLAGTAVITAHSGSISPPAFTGRVSGGAATRLALRPRSEE